MRLHPNAFNKPLIFFPPLYPSPLPFFYPFHPLFRHLKVALPSCFISQCYITFFLCFFYHFVSLTHNIPPLKCLFFSMPALLFYLYVLFSPILAFHCLLIQCFCCCCTFFFSFSYLCNFFPFLCFSPPRPSHCIHVVGTSSLRLMNLSETWPRPTSIL